MANAARQDALAWTWDAAVELTGVLAYCTLVLMTFVVLPIMALADFLADEATH